MKKRVLSLLMASAIAPLQDETAPVVTKYVKEEVLSLIHI